MFLSGAEEPVSGSDGVSRSAIFTSPVDKIHSRPKRTRLDLKRSIPDLRGPILDLTGPIPGLTGIILDLRVPVPAPERASSRQERARFVL